MSEVETIIARLDAAITLAATLEQGFAVDFGLAALRDRIAVAVREIARASEAAAPLLALLDGPPDEVEARLAAWAEARQSAALKWLDGLARGRGSEG